MILTDAEIANVLALDHFDVVTKVMPGQIPAVYMPGRNRKIYPESTSMWFHAETAQASMEMTRQYMLCESKKANQIWFSVPDVRLAENARDGYVTSVTYSTQRLPMEVIRRIRYFNMPSKRVAADLALHNLKFEEMPLEYKLNMQPARYFFRNEVAWVTLRTVACDDSIAAYHQLLEDIVKNSEGCDTVWHTNDVAFVPAHGNTETGGQKYHAELVILPFNSKMHRTPWGN